MSSSVKRTKSGIPIPLDATGRDMCLLFIKYGRCRFKNKCKKSHWMPPLPDEPYPKPPPLPSSPPRSSSVTDVSTQAQVNSTQTCLVSEQRQNCAFETGLKEKTCMALLEKGTNSDLVLGDFNKACRTMHQCEAELLKCVAQSTERTHLYQVMPAEIQRSNINPTLATNNFTTVQQNVGHVMDKKVEKEAERGDKISEDFMRQPRADDSSVERQQKESVMDRISQCIYKKRCRFDFLYHPSTQAKGGFKFKSSIDQSYQQYGAYYDKRKKKLDFHYQPRNKVEKKNFKLLRRAHWNACQELKVRLAQIPPGYSVKVDFTRVNFNRLRPYFYLLVHQCFFHQEPCEKRWKPTSFSCQVVETLIALFTAENVTSVEAESKMEDWGGSPIKVRQCISHMWNIIVKSSLSVSGVAEEVVNCESKVFAKKLSAVDFAYACSLARPSLKGTAGGNCLSKFTPAVTKSLRKGLFAAKTAALLCARRRLTSKPVAMKVTKSRVLESGLKTQNEEDQCTKGLTCKRKKRKLTRPKHISLLDGQGRQNLLNRCNTILTVEKG